MNEDKLILAQAEDRIRQCEERSYMTSTSFLDPHQQSVLRQAIARQSTHGGYGCSLEFYGGYPDAERVVLVCLPDYLTLENAEPLTVIRVRPIGGGSIGAARSPGSSSKGKQLTHRDYLGSLMGMGIKREMIGDILVRDDGADIIVLDEMSDYLMREYRKAGRTNLSAEQVSIADLIIPEPKVKAVRDTVASLRLDNMVSAAFGIPRTKAVLAIQSGLVFVNHVEASKPDASVEEGDLITLRRSGRARVTSVGGRSRKDRIYVEFTLNRR